MGCRGSVSASLWFSMGCSRTMCFTMVFITAAGEFLHWPWSTSYPFFTDLAVYKMAFLTFSYSTLLPAVFVLDFLPFSKTLSQRSWHCPCLAQPWPVGSQSCNRFCPDMGHFLVSSHKDIPSVHFPLPPTAKICHINLNDTDIHP